ncbi:MAG TPA: response regulator [Terriglobia bacterium]|nr:response regulator [Terriglobia bacterium]
MPGIYVPESERVSILVLDDDESLREILGICLEASGRCIVQPMASFQELERCFHDFGNVIAAVLDINLGPGDPTGIDAYHWLRSRGFSGRVIFLTGHATSHPLVREAQ